MTMSHENLAIIQRMIAGDKSFALTPVMITDLLKRALMGDREPLIQYFVSGGELTERERRAIGDFALNAIPKPQNRPPKIETEIRDRDIARFVAVLKLLGGKRLSDIAAAKFNVDRSYVTKLAKEYVCNEGWTAYAVAVLIGSLSADDRTGRRAMMWYANVTEDDLRAATERKRRMRK
jgi:hypothetical protein